MERRLKGRGGVKDSETKGLGFEDMGSHWRLLSTMRQGHFWDGNFAARRDELQAEKLETGEELQLLGIACAGSLGLTIAQEAKINISASFPSIQGQVSSTWGGGERGRAPSMVE